MSKAKRPMIKAKAKINPWDAAKTLEVIRGNHMSEPAPLEPGVKFFVLMLEKLGCVTMTSCEGHPDNFYIAFHGPAWAVAAIDTCDHFTISLFRTGYRMSLGYAELATYWEHEPWTCELRDQILRSAATAWSQRFGGIGVTTPTMPGTPAFVNLIERSLVAAYVHNEPELKQAVDDVVVAMAAIRDIADRCTVIPKRPAYKPRRVQRGTQEG